MTKLAPRISFLLALLALAACGDDDSAPITDAGPGDDAAAPVDAGDTTAPAVIATSRKWYMVAGVSPLTGAATGTALPPLPALWLPVVFP